MVALSEVQRSEARRAVTQVLYPARLAQLERLLTGRFPGTTPPEDPSPGRQGSRARIEEGPERPMPGEGGFLGTGRLAICDLLVYGLCREILDGDLATTGAEPALLDAFPGLGALTTRVERHPRVAEWRRLRTAPKAQRENRALKQMPSAARCCY